MACMIRERRNEYVCPSSPTHTLPSGDQSPQNKQVGLSICLQHGAEATERMGEMGEKRRRLVVVGVGGLGSCHLISARRISILNTPARELSWAEHSIAWGLCQRHIVFDIPSHGASFVCNMIIPTRCTGMIFFLLLLLLFFSLFLPPSPSPYVRQASRKDKLLPAVNETP